VRSEETRQTWHRYGGGFTEELDRLGGLPTDKEEKFTKELFSLLEAADKEADAEEKESIWRLFAAFMSAYNADVIDADGKRDIKKWDGKAPTAARDPAGGYVIERKQFVDHTYRIRHKESGTIAYVSEPYLIDEEGLRELVELIDEGWAAAIRGSMCLHFPGHSVQVLLTRKDF
jgi:hypothetical protein